MIKNITYILPLILITILVSCAKDDHSSSSEQLFSIQLGAGMEEGQNVTRATGAEAAADLGNKFYVYGYKNSGTALQEVFPGYIVNYIANSASTTASNSRGWEYVGQQESSDPSQIIKYWDAGASEYTFFGVTNNTTADKSTSPVSFSYVLDATLLGTDKPEESSEQHNDWVYNNSLYISDLWRTESPSSCIDSPVTLTFRRPFCKVRIMFIDEDGEAYTNKSVLNSTTIDFRSSDETDETQMQDRKLIQTATFKVTYPKSGGSGYTFTTTVPTSTLEKIQIPYEERISETQTTPYFSTSSEDFQKWYTLIPPTTQDSYTLSLRLAGLPKTAVVPAQFMQWKPGYAYTYIFKIPSNLNDNIEFDVANVEIWKDIISFTNDEHDGYGTAGW